MVQNEKRLISPDKREQALLYRHRQRTLGLRDVREGLHRTHFLELSPAPTFDTGDLFPDRSTVVTLVTAIRQIGVTPAGLIYEFSDATDGGLVAWLEDGSINVQVGASEGSPNTDSIHVQHTIADVVGAEYKLAVTVIPGAQKLFVWVNGAIVARETNTGGTFPGSPKFWCPDTGGSFNAAPNGVISAGVPGGSQQAPADFEVIEPLSIYVGQKPRHFV